MNDLADAEVEEEFIDQRFGKRTKVEHYGWNLLDEIGTMMWIDKRELRVDRAYQRDELREAAILRMASNWSWIACGAIIVAVRDGVPYVVDGQQRSAAAMKRADIKKMPALVFNTTDQKEEAAGFLRANTERRNVKMIEKLKAMLLAGDDIAFRIYEMAEDAGRTICNRSDGKSLKCVHTLYRNLKTSRVECERIWPLILVLCDGKNISERILDALVYLEKNATESIVGTKWEGRIISIGYDRINKACLEAAAYFTKGGAKVWCSGILVSINKGMRNKIGLKSSE